MSEPRKGLRAGNIAGSFNIFYKDLLNEDSSFKSTSELETIYKEKGVDVDALASKFIINSCGSGVTACVNLVA
jgi:3-mercaptopyruvate sulfurtransferase SseA